MVVRFKGRWIDVEKRVSMGPTTSMFWKPGNRTMPNREGRAASATEGRARASTALRGKKNFMTAQAGERTIGRQQRAGEVDL
jgi:hypothetical protein